MNRFFLILFLLFYTSFFAQTINDLRSDLQTFQSDKDLKNATISFYALDLTSNQVIASLGSTTALVPASTMKVITTATAIELFGANKRFETTLKYDGSIDSNRVLHGNIYIKGGGDPCLGADRYKKKYGRFIDKWAKKIIQLGIDSINGKVIGDASIFSDEIIPDTWILGDLGNYYGAIPSGLSIYENKYKIGFKSGNKVDSPTSIDTIIPYIPNLTFYNNVKSIASTRDQSSIIGAPYQENRITIGGIPLNKKRFFVKGSIPDPAYLCAYELDARLKELGVRIVSLPTTIRRLNGTGYFSENKRKKDLITTYSPELASIIKQTNTYSINLYAEHLMNHIRLYLNEKNNSIESFWANNGIDTEGMYIEDGSGLSRFNAVTSKHLVDVLAYMYKSDNYDFFLKSFPVSGLSGTLVNFGKGTIIEGKLKAKSGYMTRVRAYAGYTFSENGKAIAFAIIVNNYNCSPYKMKNKIEKLITKLIEIGQ